MNTIPKLSVDLIRMLREEYPPRCIGRDEHPAEAHRYAGRVELIDELVEAVRADTGRPEWPL